MEEDRLTAEQEVDIMMHIAKILSAVMLSAVILSVSTVSAGAFETSHDDKYDIDWLILNTMKDMELLEDNTWVIVGGDYYYVEANIGYYNCDETGNYEYPMEGCLEPHDYSQAGRCTIDGCHYDYNDIKASFLGYSGTDSTVTVPDVVNAVPVTTISSTLNSKWEDDDMNINLGDSVKTLKIGKNVRKIHAYYDPWIDEDGHEDDKVMAYTAIDVTPSLEKIIVDEENDTFSSRDGVLYSKDGKSLIRCPIAKSGFCVVPEGTEIIRTAAFANTHITALQLPSTLKEVHSYAFDGCQAEKIYIPASCELRGSLFVDSGFKEMIFQKGCTSLPQDCFGRMVALEEIWLPSTIQNETELQDAFLSMEETSLDSADPSAQASKTCTVHCTRDSLAAKVLKDKSFLRLEYIDSDDDIPLPEILSEAPSTAQTSQPETSVQTDPEESSKVEASMAPEGKTEEKSEESSKTVNKAESDVSKNDEVSKDPKNTGSGAKGDLITTGTAETTNNSASDNSIILWICGAAVVLAVVILLARIFSRRP